MRSELENEPTLIEEKAVLEAKLTSLQQECGSTVKLSEEAKLYEIEALNKNIETKQEEIAKLSEYFQAKQEECMGANDLVIDQD